MQIQTRQSNGIYICEVSGDVDMYSAQTLHKTWLDHTGQSRPMPFILDLQNTAYLDSSGIGVLVQILADAMAKKIPYCICNVHGMVEKLMHLSRMNSLLPVEKTLEAAVARVRK